MQQGNHLHRSIAMAAMATLAVSGTAAAEGISYNFAEAGYVSNEIDSFGLDGSGFAINGSFAIGNQAFAFAGVTDANYDQNSDVNSTAVSVGLGVRLPLGETMDLTSAVSYENLRLRFSGIGIGDEDGIGVQVGLRSRLGANFELTSSVKYTDFGSGINDYTIGVGGRYYFTPVFAAGIDVSDNDDGTAWNIMLRYDFGGSR